MTAKQYYSHGKLLITGEYLVIKGALALAVPTVFGQKMLVREEDNETVRQGDNERGDVLSWDSYYNGECWFEAEFSLPGMEVINTSNDKTAVYIQSLLQQAHSMNPGCIKKGTSYALENFLEFSPEWGLGSSSSLINNIASWFNIKAYDLFSKMHKGSAYDIACAAAEGPLWYRRVMGSPVSQPVVFEPPFKDRLLFVYSGKKQNSEASIGNFLETIQVEVAAKERINEISRALPVEKGQQAFNALIDEHEDIMATVLGLPKIKEQSFHDFPGSIKSLGAWGGDFLLASAEVDIGEIKAYFSTKGLTVSFGWDEMIMR